MAYRDRERSGRGSQDDYRNEDYSSYGYGGSSGYRGSGGYRGEGNRDYYGDRYGRSNAGRYSASDTRGRYQSGYDDTSQRSSGYADDLGDLSRRGENRYTGGSRSGGYSTPPVSYYQDEYYRDNRYYPRYGDENLDSDNDYGYENYSSSPHYGGTNRNYAYGAQGRYRGASDDRNYSGYSSSSYRDRN